MPYVTESEQAFSFCSEVGQMQANLLVVGLCKKCGNWRRVRRVWNGYFLYSSKLMKNKVLKILDLAKNTDRYGTCLL